MVVPHGTLDAKYLITVPKTYERNTVMINDIYFKQAELLLRILPIIDREAVFALKSGQQSIFSRLPRISVDIDLAYLNVDERNESLRK